MTDLIVIRTSKLSQSPNQKDDIYQEINEKPGFRVFFFFLNPQGQSCTSGRDRELGCYYVSWGFFPGGSAIKNPSANMGDVGSIPKSGRSPGEGNATHSSSLAWKFPWTEESGGLESMESKRLCNELASEQQLCVLNKLPLLVFSGLCRSACGILVPRGGCQPVPAALEAWSPDHGTARKVPSLHFFVS